jgi:hypothetical protein
MTDNVVPFGAGKSGTFTPPDAETQQVDDIKAYVRAQNEDHLTTYLKGVEEGEVRSLVTIALNYDGSVNWSISGQCSSFEIIAALERTKFDFMDEN